MPSLQDIKSVTEKLTGGLAIVLLRPRKANTFLFKGDGETPNNPKYPLILYRSPVSLTGAADPAAVFEVLFAANGWKPEWRASIYPYNHFHTGTHEVVGVARGHARVRYGGEAGRTVELRAGDVAIHPAGVGHQRLSASNDFLVVGAYPKTGSFDQPRPGEIDYRQAEKNISKVPLPGCDPVYGADGPLVTAWRSA